jgi:hypothetical protein
MLGVKVDLDVFKLRKVTSRGIVGYGYARGLLTLRWKSLYVSMPISINF